MRTSKQVIRITNNRHSLNSSPKTKARENSRMLVKAIVFLLGQSAMGRVVHGSSQIGFGADPYSTRWSWVTKN